MSKLMFHNHEYEVGTDAKGRPNKISRYHNNSELHITILFSSQKNPKLVDEIKHDLKDMSIARIIISPKNKVVL